jgi:glycosyltransferase involved in cell wall biosynthesis
MAEPSRVGLNLVFLLAGMGGMEMYARRLIPGLLELRPDLRLTVFVKAETRRRLAAEPWGNAVELVTHPLLGRRFLSAASELTLLGRLAAEKRVDLLHSLSMTAPIRLSAANVITIPDLIWWHHPDSLSRVTTSLWRMLVPPVARRADRIVTFSNASREDIVDLLRVPREAVDVIPLAAGLERDAHPVPEERLRKRLLLREGPIVLAVSTKIKHKNVLALIDAMPLVLEAQPGAVLVVPGRPTAYERILAKEVKRLGLIEHVRLPDWLEPDELESLYRHATCFVYPSLREGFGLPVLEAMARGLPVACTNTSSVPEVAGNAVRFFDPHNTEEIAAAVIDLLRDEELRRDLVEAGYEQERKYTWRGTAEATLASYERAYAERLARAE